MDSLFQTTDNALLPNNPFYKSRVACIGEFVMGNKVLYKRLRDFGANINNACISKTTNFVVVGKNPNPKKLEKIDTLQHDGFSLTRIVEDDVARILNGEEWDKYHAQSQVVKDLDFTIEHFYLHHFTFDEGVKNKMARKELYFCDGFRKDKSAIEQITGNLSAWSNYVLCPQIQIFVLSNKTIEKLKNGEKDENIKMIQDYYNQNRSDKFDFSFTTENDILNFAKLWCETYNDKVTYSLYNRYIQSEY